MNNTMVIVSGMAAAGKTTFAEWLSKELDIPLFSVDDLVYWESEEDYPDAISQYWLLCENAMKQFSPLIIEYGFWDEQKPTISELIEKYKYETVNVHFTTSAELAHQRFNDRRKLYGTKPPISLETYKEIVVHSRHFQFGNQVISVDTTDFTAVSYGDIAKQILRYTTQNGVARLPL